MTLVLSKCPRHGSTLAAHTSSLATDNPKKAKTTVMETVRYGIIGCGMMGMEHIENIGLLPHGQVSAVFDPVDDLAQRRPTGPEARRLRRRLLTSSLGTT